MAIMIAKPDDVMESAWVQEYVWGVANWGLNAQKALPASIWENIIGREDSQANPWGLMSLACLKNKKPEIFAVSKTNKEKYKTNKGFIYNIYK